MISLKDLYTVVSAVVPLYVTMFLAYGSVKWWKIFSAEQCAGINRFVAIFAVPLLSFEFIYRINPYKMNFRFIAADAISKAIVLLVLALWGRFSQKGSLDWVITLFSLSTLPNTLVMGIPLLRAMYGEYSKTLMVQTVVLQCIIWYTLLLFLFEYRSAKILIAEQFPGAANSIASFKVESDVLSLDGGELLQTDAEVGEDGKLHVIVRKSSSSQGNSAASSQRFQGLSSIKTFTPGRPMNHHHHADIYSLQSSRNLTPRDSSFNRAEYVSMTSGRAMSPVQPNNNNNNSSSNGNSPYIACDGNSLHSSRGHTPRTSNCNEENYRDLNSGQGLHRSGNSNSSPRLAQGPNCNGGHYYGFKGNSNTTALVEPLENGAQGESMYGSNREQLHGSTVINLGCRTVYAGTHLGVNFSPNAVQLTKRIPDSRSSPKLDEDAKELHMFVWSSSGSPVSERGLQLLSGSDFGLGDSSRREFDNIREERGITTPGNEQLTTRGNWIIPQWDSIPTSYTRIHYMHKAQISAIVEVTTRKTFSANKSSEMIAGLIPEPAQACEEDPHEEDFSFGNKSMNAEAGDKEGPRLSKFTSSSTAALTPKLLAEADVQRNDSPPAAVMINLILNMVWRKLVRNPNSYASVIGMIWALTSCRYAILHTNPCSRCPENKCLVMKRWLDNGYFCCQQNPGCGVRLTNDVPALMQSRPLHRWHFKMPQIVQGSITILSDAGLGMAMFSLGLFMALQPRIIACGKSLAMFGMVLRFLTGPAVMAVASIAAGLRGSILHIAIVQVRANFFIAQTLVSLLFLNLMTLLLSWEAALPQGIVPFVFAREYSLHPDVLSTAVIFGMIVSLPITLQSPWEGNYSWKRDTGIENFRSEFQYSLARSSEDSITVMESGMGHPFIVVDISYACSWFGESNKKLEVNIKYTSGQLQVPGFEFHFFSVYLKWA
eukprot:Gb_03217 [translate_table: standard]